MQKDHKNNHKETPMTPKTPNTFIKRHKIDTKRSPQPQRDRHLLQRDRKQTHKVLTQIHKKDSKQQETKHNHKETQNNLRHKVQIPGDNIAMQNGHNETQHDHKDATRSQNHPKETENNCKVTNQSTTKEI